MSLTPQLYSTALESNSTEIGWGVLPYNNKLIYIIELLEPSWQFAETEPAAFASNPPT